MVFSGKTCYKMCIVGSALNLIRVPTMELKEFADGPAQTGLYSLQESHDIFLHFTATNKPQMTFSTIPRKGLKPLVKILAMKIVTVRLIKVQEFD